MAVFPFAFSGGFTIANPQSGGLSSAAALDRVQAMLEAVAATRCWREGASVQFTVKMFRFVNAWNELATIGGGRIDVADRGGAITVSYVVSTRRFALVAGFAVAFAIIVLAAAAAAWSARSTESAPWPLAPAAFVLVYAANLWIARIRFRNWLRAGLTKPGG